MNARVALWLAIAVIASAGRVCAQTVEVTPFVGYETAGEYPPENPNDIQTLRADAARTHGFFFDYRLLRNVQAEFLWVNNATTYVATPTDPAQAARTFRTSIDQYQVGGLFHLRDRDAAVRPYLAAGLGVTHDSNGGALPNRSAFGFSLGGGLKYEPTRRVGARIDARWMPTYGSSEYGTACDVEGFCYPDNIANYLERVNITAGLVIRL